MKAILLITVLLLTQKSFSQDDLEVIKIEVDKDCKSMIKKKTYKDEIYTMPIRIVNTLNTVVTLMFAYQENFMYEDKGPVLDIWFNEEFITRYDTKHIYFTIDGKEFDLSKFIDFETYDQKNLYNEIKTWWGLGFYLDSELTSAFDNAKDMKMAMIGKNTHERKIWNFKQALVDNIAETYDCFVKNYTPIDERLKEERRIAQEEYEKNLKTFEKNYRNSNWKDSKEIVMASQIMTPSIDIDDALSYGVQLNNDNFYAFYYFNRDRLYQGVYFLDEDYVSENSFYRKYKEIKGILTGKYGTPKFVTKHRSSDLNDGANEIGMAIQKREYTEYALWETKNSTIKLIIEGESYDSELSIKYNTKDPELLKEARKESKERRTEGF